MSSRKPLFSRQQLNWLIIILIAVIALLSLTPSAVSWPPLQRQAVGEAALISPQQASPHPALLRITLALPPYLASADPLAVQLETLLLEQLPSHLKAELQRQRLPDRLRLTLALADRPSIEAVLTALAQRPSAARLITAERQLTAARNLQHQAVPNSPWRLSQASEPPLSQLFDNWLSQSQIALATSQPVDRDLRDFVSNRIAQLPSGHPWDSTPPPLPDSVSSPRAGLQQPQMRLLRALPGRSDPQFDTTRLTLLWLRELAAEAGIQLSWQPRRGQSRLLLGAPGADAQALLNNLQQAIIASSDTTESFRKALNSRLQQQFETPMGYLDLLDTIATYQLPLDALPRFAATIADLDADSLRQQALELLQPDAFRTIRLIPLTPEPNPHAAPIQPSRPQ